MKGGRARGILIIIGNSTLILGRPIECHLLLDSGTNRQWLSSSLNQTVGSVRFGLDADMLLACYRHILWSDLIECHLLLGLWQELAMAQLKPKPNRETGFKRFGSVRFRLELLITGEL